jgi:hypothetical protein
MPISGQPAFGYLDVISEDQELVFGLCLLQQPNVLGDDRELGRGQVLAFVEG